MTLDTRNDPGRVGAAAGAPNGKLAQELAEVVEEAQRASESGHGETAPWSYSVPFPGVRYYVFDERPPGADR